MKAKQETIQLAIEAAHRQLKDYQSSHDDLSFSDRGVREEETHQQKLIQKLEAMVEK